MTAVDVCRAVLRRWPSVAIVTVLVTVAVVALLVAWPNRYASEGMLFVRLGRGSVSLDPTTTTSSTISLQESRSAEVISVREMVNSRAMARQVVDAIGADEVLRPRHWSSDLLRRLQAYRPAWAGGRIDDSPQGRQYAAAIEQEEAIEAVQRSLSVSVADNAYTVVVQAHAADPYLAQAIVQTAMDAANHYHLQAHRADGSLEFFDRQHQQAFEAAMAAQQALKEAKNRMGMLSAESKELSLRERITQLQTQLDQTAAEAKASEAEVQELKQQVASLDQWIPTETTTGVANGAGEGMRTALFGLEMEGSETAARYTPEHPLYRQMQERLEASKEIVGKQTQERSLTQEALNPIRQEIEAMLRQSEARAAGLHAQQQSLQALQQAAHDELRQLNSDAVQLAQLQWQASIAEQNYLAHARSLEQARVLHALDREQISDLSVIQPAALMLKKVGPPRSLLSVVGCLLGLALGLLQALLRDGAAAAVPAHAGGHPRPSTPTQWHTRQGQAAHRSVKVRGAAGHVDNADAGSADSDEEDALVGPVRPR